MLRTEYEEITQKMLEESDDFELTIHGVLFKRGVENLGPFEQFKHFEFVKRGGGRGGGDGNDSWDVPRGVPEHFRNGPVPEISRQCRTPALAFYNRLRTCCQKMKNRQASSRLVLG